MACMVPSRPSATHRPLNPLRKGPVIFVLLRLHHASASVSTHASIRCAHNLCVSLIGDRMLPLPGRRLPRPTRIHACPYWALSSPGLAPAFHVSYTLCRIVSPPGAAFHYVYTQSVRNFSDVLAPRIVCIIDWSRPDHHGLAGGQHPGHSPPLPRRQGPRHPGHTSP